MQSEQDVLYSSVVVMEQNEGEAKSSHSLTRETFVSSEELGLLNVSLSERMSVHGATVGLT